MNDFVDNIKFEVGLPVYEVSNGMTIFITQYPPNIFGNKFVGYTVTRLGYACGDNQIHKSVQEIDTIQYQEQL